MSNVAPSAESSLQGKSFPITNENERREVLLQAFDYRGDVALDFADGNKVEGYLFHADDQRLKLYVKGNETPQEFPASALSGLSFSGKDPADGKSYDNWKSKKAGQRQAEIDAHEAEMRAKGYL